MVEEEGWETVVKSKPTKESKTATALKTAAAVNEPAKADAKKKGKKKGPVPDLADEPSVPGAIFKQPEASSPKKKAAPLAKKVVEEDKESAEPKDPQKELLKWKKKLRECQALVERKANGEKMLENQETKIANKAQILAEIAKIDANDAEVKELMEEQKEKEEKLKAKENEEARKYLAELKAQKEGKVAVPAVAKSDIPNDPFVSEKKKKKGGYVDPWVLEEQKKAEKQAKKTD